MSCRAYIPKKKEEVAKQHECCNHHVEAMNFMKRCLFRLSKVGRCWLHSIASYCLKKWNNACTDHRDLKCWPEGGRTGGFGCKFVGEESIERLVIAIKSIRLHITVGCCVELTPLLLWHGGTA